MGRRELSGAQLPLAAWRLLFYHLPVSTVASSPQMQAASPEELRALAARCFWWQTPEEALAFPRRFIARVMDIGGFADFLLLESHYGAEAMRDALLHAEPGWLRPRSWYFWHYRLGLTPCGAEPPPMPVRKYEEQP